MSWIDDEFTTAAAAAAYAIYTLEELKPWIWNETTYPDKSMNRMKSKAKDTGLQPEPRKVAPQFSGETSRQSFEDPDIKMKSKEEDAEIVPELRKSPLQFSDKTSKQSFKDSDMEMPERPLGEKYRERGPSMGLGRPPTFAGKHSDTNEMVPKPDSIPSGWSMNQPTEIRKESVRKPVPRDYVADAWTKEEMADIKERYERLRETIDNWEAKKKMKANLKKERREAKLGKRRAEAAESGEMEKIKAKLEKKRAKAVRSYRSEIARIEEIVAGARAQAEENRRNEEFKVKEKANKIRITGELPKQTCLCF